MFFSNKQLKIVVGCNQFALNFSKTSKNSHRCMLLPGGEQAVNSSSNSETLRHSPQL